MIDIVLSKGRIEKEFTKMLGQMGIDTSPLLNASRKLTVVLEKNYRIFLVKSSDIVAYLLKKPGYLGIVGSDVLLENESDEIEEILDLPFGHCYLALCGKPNFKNCPKTSLKVATKYPRITSKYFMKKGQKVDIVKLNGSIELACLIGLSDIICDIVATGDTLRANGLEIIDKICPINAKIVKNRAFKETPEIAEFIRRVKTKIGE